MLNEAEFYDLLEAMAIIHGEILGYIILPLLMVFFFFFALIRIFAIPINLLSNAINKRLADQLRNLFN